MATRAVPLAELAGGVLMPQLGLGTLPLTYDEVVPAVVAALRCGYRLIDTAEVMATKPASERACGQAASHVRTCSLRRSPDGKFQRRDLTVRGIDESLTRLGLDYDDLLLTHCRCRNGIST